MRRRFEEALMRVLMLGATLLIIGSLLLIMGVVIWKGLPAMNLDMIIKTSSASGFYLGKGGGLANAIVGSLYLALGGTILSLLISLPLALYLQREYGGRSRLAGGVRLALDALWGIPSIVYGAFGFLVMLLLGLRTSLLAGIFVLALLELPIMARAMDEVIQRVPAELKAASYAVGATRWETTCAAVIRQALPGLLTAIILSFGRGIGDAASILFTAGYSDHLPRSLLDPVASLPLATFFLLGTPYPATQVRAYAAAFILLILVLVVSIISRTLARRFEIHVIR
jgi:phosphate transport system permease protein